MSEAVLPPYVDTEEIAARLPEIFPEGTPNRGYCVRDMAAKTVFTALYVGAVEGNGRYFAPKHVYRMTDEQAAESRSSARLGYAADALRPGYRPEGNRWYADNTREPIRDETLREGLVAIGAASARTDLPTTSSKPRYALDSDFATLFSPSLRGASLRRAIAEWQRTHLSKGALARITLRRRGAAASEEGVLVRFPNGESRRMAPGPSSMITQAVVEVFCTRFLGDPVVLWLSESGNKVVARDDALAAEIGLNIAVDRDLPDIILVDLAPTEPLLLFVEVVATDGPIGERRRAALMELTQHAGFAPERVFFLTAYADRDALAFKKTVSALAWGAFVWFASEPDNLVLLREGRIELAGLEPVEPKPR